MSGAQPSRRTPSSAAADSRSVLISCEAADLLQLTVNSVELPEMEIDVQHAPEFIIPKEAVAAASPTGTPQGEGVFAPNGLTVAVRNVSRSFGEVKALNDLTIEVPTGRITVLLGPNGAGKTTAIRTITGALAPHEGTVQVFGVNPIEHGEEVRSRCGVVSAKPALYDRLSGWHNLEYAADLYEVNGNKAEKIREAAARFNIEHALDQPVGGYSTGMKTRLALSRSVLHEPDLLLFDEPTSGLDPESAHAVLALIREMTATGTTVVMCTHHLAEAEGLADRIVMLESGTDLIAGAPEDLTARYWPQAIVKLQCTEGDLAAVHELPGVLGADIAPDGLRAEIRLDHEVRIPDIVGTLVEKGVRLTKIDPFEPKLEDLYFAVRNEAREQGKVGEVE